MILARGAGQAGHLLGAIVNDSDEEVEVTLVLGPDGPTVPVEVPSGDLANFADTEVIVPSVDEAPGATLTSAISSEDSGVYTIEIPVLDGTLSPYDRYLDRNLP